MATVTTSNIMPTLLCGHSLDFTCLIVHTCVRSFMQRARSAGRETEKARACTNQPPPSAIPGGGWGADFSRSFVAGMEVRWTRTNI